MKNKTNGIIIFGPNGSGKTTLGRELAKALHYKHMDIEDYYFEKTGDFGDEIQNLYTLGVHIVTPQGLCLERIRKREIEQFGSRVLIGGDMYDSQLAFHKFVRNRSYEHMEQWAKTLICPIVWVDGTKPISHSLHKLCDDIKSITEDQINKKT